MTVPFSVEIVMAEPPVVESQMVGVQGPPGTASTVPGPAGPAGPPGAAGPAGPPGQWVSMTQAAYDALAVKDPATLYVIIP